MPQNQSTGNLSLNSENRMFRTMDKRPLKGLEMQIKSKLAYEWKNIYRSLAQIEGEDGTIKAKDL